MVGVLTWPAHGTWLAGPGRGWVDPQGVVEGGVVPEPDAEVSEARRRSLKWPAVRLDGRQQRSILEDLARIGVLREFEPVVGVAAADHVHVLLEADADRYVPRMVQLIKGSLSRMLTVSGGDEAAVTTLGQAVAHHKWWARQYSFLRVADTRSLEAVQRRLLAHEGEGAAVRTDWSEAWRVGEG